MREIWLSFQEAKVILKTESGIIELTALERQLLREIKLRFVNEPVWFWYLLVQTAIEILNSTQDTLGPKNISTSFSDN